MLNRGSYLDRPEELALFGGVRGKGMHKISILNLLLTSSLVRTVTKEKTQLAICLPFLA
jgi:hypothetical protein